MFLRLYEQSDDPNIFDNLKRVAVNLVTTEQVINEFARNRQRLLAKARNAFSEAAVETSKGDSGLVRHISEWTHFEKARQEFSKAKATIADGLTAIVAGTQPDPLATAFDGLWKLPGVKCLPTTSSLILQAQRRKILGAPPTTPDKYTIGDELNWECLLELREDLLVVSRDKGHLDYAPVLEREYLDKTQHKLIMVESKLSAAITKLGQQPSNSLVDVEKKPESLSISIAGATGPTRISFLVADPPYNGFTGGAQAFLCPRCGNFAYGVRCGKCGFTVGDD